MVNNIERYNLLYNELKRIEDVLKNNYQAKKIYLFGSFSRKQVNENSDVDILIVKNTDKPFLKRLRDVRKLIKPRLAFDFLVYTEKEIQKNENNYFIREILKKGRKVDMENDSQVKKWIDFAKEDLAAGEIMMNEKIYNKVCFFSQQGAEKLLKVMILKKRESIPKLHSISELLFICKELYPSIDVDEDALIGLDDYSIPTRYPDAVLGSLPEGLPDKEDAENALKSVKKLYDWIIENNAALSEYDK